MQVDLLRKENYTQILNDLYHKDLCKGSDFDIVGGHKRFWVKAIIPIEGENTYFLFDLDSKETMIYGDNQWNVILEAYESEVDNLRFEPMTTSQIHS